MSGEPPAVTADARPADAPPADARPGAPMRYYVYLEGEPTLDGYRLSHAPQPGLCPVFLCPYAVVSDASGRLYNVMRGVQGQDKGSVVNMGAYRLNGELDAQCPMLFSWEDSPVSEPYSVTEDGDSVSYVGETFKLQFGVDRYLWEDAGGRIRLQARRLGQVCTFSVPAQAGYECPQLMRNHLAKVDGTIDGEPVEGLFMLDYIYSRPDAMWSEIGMLSKLHNLWMNWLVEYEDGSLEGGYAWRGRPGTGFAAAHHYVDGASTARSDPVIETRTTQRGTVSEMSVRLGGVALELEQLGSTDWPLHTCGIVSSISHEKPIARSWNFTEYFPLNWQSVADYQVAHHALYGRHPSFRRLMEGARIDGQRLVFD
jgi:hypothetical protein